MNIIFLAKKFKYLYLNKNFFKQKILMKNEIFNVINLFLNKYWWAILILIVVFFIDAVLRAKKVVLRKNYETKYQNIDEKVQDDSIFSELYKKIYHIDLIRIGLLTLTFVWILFTQNPWSFWFLFVSLWWLIVALREYILSFITFFYLNTIHSVWDHIVIRWKDIQWEIVYIRPLYIWIVSKDENWDNEGKFISFLNANFVNEYIIKKDLKLTANKLYTFDINYDPNVYSIGFESFLSTILTHLDVSLPKRKSDEIPNYKSYIWYKYKYDLELLEGGKINIVIKIIWLKHTIRQIKYEIYLILERFSTKKDTMIEKEILS